MFRRSGVLGLGVAVAFVLVAGTGVAEAFDAHGSVRQVYATGLAPKAKASLVKGGHKLQTRRADGLGGLLFRNVKPGRGYRVRLAKGGAKSGRLRVISTRPAPPSTTVYDQSIASSGYSYLTTRDGTQLAIDVHPPQDLGGMLPAGVDPQDLAKLLHGTGEACIAFDNEQQPVLEPTPHGLAYPPRRPGM